MWRQIWPLAAYQAASEGLGGMPRPRMPTAPRAWTIDHAGEPLPSRRGTQPVPYVAPEVAAYWLASLNRGAAIDGALSVGLVAHESLDA